MGRRLDGELLETNGGEKMQYVAVVLASAEGRFVSPSFFWICVIRLDDSVFCVRCLFLSPLHSFPRYNQMRHSATIVLAVLAHATTGNATGVVEEEPTDLEGEFNRVLGGYYGGGGGGYIYGPPPPLPPGMYGPPPPPYYPPPPPYYPPCCEIVCPEPPPVASPVASPVSAPVPSPVPAPVHRPA